MELLPAYAFASRAAFDAAAVYAVRAAGRVLPD